LEKTKSLCERAHRSGTWYGKRLGQSIRHCQGPTDVLSRISGLSGGGGIAGGFCCCETVRNGLVDCAQAQGAGVRKGARAEAAKAAARAAARAEARAEAMVAATRR
jgi:hypothetical protein